ncbi:hypothetical protein NA57DRAFT_58570 [Rhizodiscina lignyota]|uniref:DUF3844 domain-containing protein n=1 Tax=Rhizodiscina lignyota TaxID=1504668 RepID=A0A9P4M4D0_9PEZI|nr:hypothetical protein NA57DRAFT_58570 [Rhizodiscina lignyota]
MRWSASFSFLLLLRVWSATAESLKEPIVFLYDPDTQSSSIDATSAPVTPETARLIFADRIGLSQLYDLSNTDDAAINQINQYGGDQHVFGFQRPQWGQSKSLIIIDGVRERPENMETLRTFTMTETPSTEQTLELFRRLDWEAQELLSPSPYHDKTPSTASQRIEKSLIDFIDDYGGCGYGGSRAFGEISITRLQCDMDSSRTQSALKLFYKIASEEQMKLTILMTPTSPSNPSKPSTMPFGPVRDVQIPELPNRKLHRRDEAILSEPVPTPSSKQASTPAAKSPPQILASSPAYPFVAQCYASAADCAKGTGNCTGHGECVLKSKTKTEGGSDECYVCSCNKPVVIKNEDGTTKTTHFGGSACQKVDISAPFWILTLTAGSLLALVGFGVSMLYAMGSAELPSVIGAGVSGPRAK